MNIEKELKKRQKRSETYGERQAKHKRKEERMNAYRKRIKPIKDWWYGLNKKARYQRQLNRIIRVIIPITKKRYLSSLVLDSSPTIHFPVFSDRSTAFIQDDYTDGFRLHRYLMDGLSYKNRKKVNRCLVVIEKLGYGLGESFLNDLRLILEKKYSTDYQVSPMQYEYVSQSFDKKPLAYFLLSINGPHPRKKL